MIYGLSSFLSLLIISLSVEAFTLNNSLAARFKNKRVKVKVASVSSTCTQAGTTSSELASLIEPAINEFWNQVPTSRLRLVDGGIFETSDNDFLNGKLCVIGDPTCTGTTVPSVEDIVISCNSNTANNFTSGSLLALTLPVNLRNKNIVGAVILINNANGSVFGQLSKQEKISVIAHEIGHAIGLGHATDRSALMYYQTIPDRFSLGQDDIDGVTYLYPVKIDGCGLLASSTNQRNTPKSWMWSFGIDFLIGILLFYFFKKLNLFRAQHR